MGGNLESLYKTPVTGLGQESTGERRDRACCASKICAGPLWKGTYSHLVLRLPELEGVDLQNSVVGQDVQHWKGLCGSAVGGNLELSPGWNWHVHRRMWGWSMLLAS